MDPIIIINPGIFLMVISFIIIVLLEIFLLIHLVIFYRTYDYSTSVFATHIYSGHYVTVLLMMIWVPNAILNPWLYISGKYFSYYPIPNLFLFIIVFMFILSMDYYFKKIISYLKKKKFSIF